MSAWNEYNQLLPGIGMIEAYSGYTGIGNLSEHPGKATLTMVGTKVY
jgi:hypothetical protein